MVSILFTMILILKIYVDVEQIQISSKSKDTLKSSRHNRLVLFPCFIAYVADSLFHFMFHTAPKRINDIVIITKVIAFLAVMAVLKILMMQLKATVAAITQ